MTDLAPAQAPPQPALRLWTRNFRLYYAARIFSLIGDSMLPVALSVAAIKLGFGTSGIGFALGAWMIGLAVCTPFGGVLADRFSPKRMMLIAAVARLLIQLVMAGVLASGEPQLWHIVALQLASGVASGLFQPGTASLIPQVTGDVQRANASLRIAESMLNLGGPAIAGVLVAVAGPAVVFTIDAAAFGISALCLAVVRLTPVAVESAGSFWRDLADGWQEFTSRTWLWSVIAIWTVYGLFVFGPSLPLGAAVIIEEHGSTAYGMIMAAFGGGTAVGGLIALRWRPQRPLFAGALVMFGFVAFPLAPILDLPAYLVGAGYLLAGASLAMWGVMWATTVQTKVPANVLNRVYAYDVAGSLVVLSLGRVLAGPAAVLVGTAPLLSASGVFAVACCCVLLSVPAIRTLRR
jgi:MFS family permease